MRARWTLRQMLWWLFIAALILPYFVQLLQPAREAPDAFSISTGQIVTWVKEIDDTVTYSGHPSCHGGSYDIVESCDEWVIRTDNATADEVFDHLLTRIKEQTAKESWLVVGEGGGQGGSKWEMKRGATRYHLWLWNIPRSEEDRSLEEYYQHNVTRIRVLGYGYVRR